MISSLPRLSLCLLLSAGWLGACGEEIKRVPGAYAELDLRIETPPYQDSFLGLSSFVFQFTTADGQVVERAVDHSATEFVLNLTPAEGVVLRLLGLDVDGQVLASGQSLPFDLTLDQATEVSLLFARVGEFVQLAGQIGQPRFGHTATALGDGRVLLFGGATGGTLDEPAGLASPEIYDLNRQMACDDVELACPGATAGALRIGHSATLASTDKVLVFGGRDAAGLLVDEILIFEATTGFHTLSGYDADRVQVRAHHAAAAIRVEDAGASGFRDSVVILGGEVDAGPQPVVTANGLLFDSALETFVATDLQLQHPRRHFSATTFGAERRLLLVAGGRDDSGLVLKVELFNGTNLHEVVPVGNGTRNGLAVGRIHHAAVETDAGVVLVGGQDGLLSLDAPELFLFNSGFGNGVASLDVGAAHAGHSTRSGAVALPLSTGSLVLAGGLRSDGFDDEILSSAELLVPNPEALDVAFVEAPPLGAAFAHASVTRLFNGAYLIVGGLRSADGQLPPSGEVWYYNPR